MLKIINFFKYIVEFFKFLVDGLFTIFQVIKSAFLFVVNSLSALPASILLFLIIVLAVSIAFKLTSLGGSGE